MTIRGIAKTKLKTIVASYEETKALSDLMIYLAPFGVSMKKAAMIKEEFGDQSLQIVKTDPFQLCRIKMPPDEEEDHPGCVAVSFTAAQPATPVPAPKPQSKPQAQPSAEPPKAPAPEPPKTVDEYLQVMTVDQAKMVKIDFGKFSGWTLGDIAMKSPGDLAWYVKNYSGHNLALKAGAMKLLEAAGQMAS